MPGFFDRMLGKDTSSKVQNIGYLGNLKDEASLRKLLKFLEDTDVEVRRAAAAALEQHFAGGNTKAIAALAKALGDGDAGVRKNAARSLGGFIAGPRSPEADAAEKALVGLLGRETDGGTIKNAILSLANVPDAALAGPMADALRGKDKKTIALAIEAIDDLPPTDVRAEMKRALRALL